MRGDPRTLARTCGVGLLVACAACSAALAARPPSPPTNVRATVASTALCVPGGTVCGVRVLVRTQRPVTVAVTVGSRIRRYSVAPRSQAVVVPVPARAGRVRVQVRYGRTLVSTRVVRVTPRRGAPITPSPGVPAPSTPVVPGANTIPGLVPPAGQGEPPVPGTPATGMTRGLISTGINTCAVRRDGTVACWGPQWFPGAMLPSTVPVTVPGVTRVTSVGVGEKHACAVHDTGTVMCWGRIDIWQVPALRSNPVGEGSPGPGAVAGITDAVAISAGDRNTCVLRATGGVACWGPNVLAGDGRPRDSMDGSIGQVAGISNAVRVSVGHDLACAVLADQTVRCWGSNIWGGLGQGTRNLTDGATPVQVIGLTGAIDVQVGNLGACALKADGSEVCWGSYYTRPSYSDPPYPAEPRANLQIPGAVMIAQAAGTAGCAARTGALPVCWNAPSSATTVSQVQPVPGFAGAVDITARCAIRADRTVSCLVGNGPDTAPVPDFP